MYIQNLNTNWWRLQRIWVLLRFCLQYPPGVLPIVYNIYCIYNIYNIYSLATKLLPNNYWVTMMSMVSTVSTVSTRISRVCWCSYEVLCHKFLFDWCSMQCKSWAFDSDVHCSTGRFPNPAFHESEVLCHNFKFDWCSMQCESWAMPTVTASMTIWSLASTDSCNLGVHTVL
jgi:hypothetical protein